MRRNREQAQKLVLIDALVMHIVLVFVFDNARGQYRTIGDKILKTWINHSLNLKHGSRDASTPKNNCIRKIMGSVKERGKWENIFDQENCCGWTGHYTNYQVVQFWENTCILLLFWAPHIGLFSLPVTYIFEGLGVRLRPLSSAGRRRKTREFGICWWIAFTAEEKRMQLQQNRSIKKQVLSL